MSRSFKHTPMAVYCRAWCKSQKTYKQIGNRIMRRTARIRTRVSDPDRVVYMEYEQAMPRYSMPEDGTRHYVSRNRLRHRTEEEYLAILVRVLRK